MKSAFKFDNNSCVMIITQPSGLFKHLNIAKIIYCDQHFNFKADGPEHILRVTPRQYHYQARKANRESFIVEHSSNIDLIDNMDSWISVMDHTTNTLEELRSALAKMSIAGRLASKAGEKFAKQNFSMVMQRKKKAWWQRYHGKSTKRFINLPLPKMK